MAILRPWSVCPNTLSHAPGHGTRRTLSSVCLMASGAFSWITCVKPLMLQKTDFNFRNVERRCGALTPSRRLCLSKQRERRAEGCAGGTRAKSDLAKLGTARFHEATVAQRQCLRQLRNPAGRLTAIRRRSRSRPPSLAASIDCPPFRRQGHPA
jgi:hypothetical protein